MKVTIEDISAVKKKLNIELPAEAVDQEMVKAVADLYGLQIMRPRAPKRARPRVGQCASR